MLYDCYSLTNLDVSIFDIQDINYTFRYYKLNLSNFNVQNATNMSGMFNDCDRLTNLNLSNLILKMLLIRVINFIMVKINNKRINKGNTLIYFLVYEAIENGNQMRII